MKSSVIIFILIVASLVYGQRPVNQENISKKEAERLWEQAIEAKGGRKRLYSVNNMVISSFGKNIRLEDFFVFPNRSWSWVDQRPSVLGLNMSMQNWETGKEYFVQYKW